MLYAINYAKFRIGNIEAEIKLLTKTIIPTSESPKNIKELAAKSPVKAINESWDTLEKSATAAVSPSKPSISNLLQKHILNEDEATVFWRLNNIRNDVVHQEAGISVNSASTYSDLAYTLSETIKKRKQP